MGYTHYFTQTRDFTADEWADVQADIGQILKFAEHEQGIALRSWDGEGRPLLDADVLNFNGAGEDSHENFMACRERDPADYFGVVGSGFCKTARKPYDAVVVACLCYFATVAESHGVSSNGKGRDYLTGLELARQALPSKANMLDIPMGIMEDDRWCPPFPNVSSERYDFRCCVDGRAYIMDSKSGKSYRFYSHHEAAQWAASHVEKPMTVHSSWSPGGSREGGKGLFNHSGSYNSARHDSLRKQQDRVMKAMLALAEGDRAIPPPAYVRPGEMPLMDESIRAYRLEDLLNLQAA
jgi:hypothetical protein